jgi:hypothetical protein
VDVGTVYVEVSVQDSVTSTAATVSMTLVTQIWTGYDVVMHVGVELVMTVVAMYCDVLVATLAMTVVVFIQIVVLSMCGMVVVYVAADVEYDVTHSENGSAGADPLPKRWCAGDCGAAATRADERRARMAVLQNMVAVGLMCWKREVFKKF